MSRTAVLALSVLGAASLSGCAAQRSICHPSVAGGEAYCAITCSRALAEREPCPAELPSRAEVPGAAVCRAPGTPAEVPEAICAELPQGCAPPTTMADGVDAEVRARLEAAEMAFERCEGGDEVVLVRDGTVEPSESELTAAVTARQEALRGLPGYEGGGVGLCCPASSDRGGLCVSVIVNRREATLAEVGEALAEVFAGETQLGLRFGIRAVGLPGPRCAADSPFCAPVPYEGPCLERTPYRPEAPRVRSDLGTSGGACVSDGECSVSGCGNGCHRWTEAHLAGTCEGYVLTEPAYCGCVEGSCSWFTQ